MTAAHLKKCFLPGYFTPPCEKDLQLAYWLGRKSSEISEVIVVIGQEDDSPVPLDVKKDIFDTYLKETNGNSIVKTVTSPDDAPRHYIYKLQEDHINDPFIVAVTEKVAKSNEFQKKFRKFPEYDIIIIPEYDYSLREDMLQAVRDDDMKEFMDHLPPEIHKQSVKKIFDMLKESLGEPVNDVIKDKDLKELYEKFGI